MTLPQLPGSSPLVTDAQSKKKNSDKLTWCCHLVLHKGTLQQDPVFTLHRDQCHVAREPRDMVTQRVSIVLEQLLQNEQSIMSTWRITPLSHMHVAKSTFLTS